MHAGDLPTATQREKAECVTDRDAAEAECRRQMAMVARMPRRGWDNERRRDAEMAMVDAMIDDFNEAR